MKVRIASFVLGLAAAAVVWLMVFPSGGGDVDPGGAGPDGARGDFGTAAAPEAADGREPASAAETVAGARREAADGGAGPTRGTLVVQADEVDQCIDVRGSVLVLENRSTGSTHRAVILENGGAAFEDVRFVAGRTAFALRTEVADRACYPDAFEIDRAALTGDPPAAAISVALIHRHGLGGVVRDVETGRPIEGARVAVDTYDANATETDAGGRYAVELPEPRGTLVLTAPGYQELLWRFPEQTEAGVWLPDRRDFELLPDRLTAWVELAATRADGTPAAGAEVEVTALETRAPPTSALEGMTASARRRFLESLRSDVEAFGVAAGARGDLLDPLDGGGRAWIRLRLPGRYRVAVRHGDSIGAGEVDVGVGERRPLPVTLARSSTLEVRFEADGAPMEGRRLAVTWDGGGVRIPRLDERGRASVRHVPAGVEVVIGSTLPSRFRLDGGEVRLRTPAEGGAVSVDLSGTSVEYSYVRGQVLDARTGAPIEFAMVTEQSTLASVQTGVGGSYELLAPPDVDLRITAYGYRDATATRVGAAAELPPARLEPFGLDPGSATGSVRVRVVDADGAPLEGARVRLVRGRLEGPGDRRAGGLPSFHGVAGADGVLAPTLGWPLAPGESAHLRLHGKLMLRTGAVDVVVRAGEHRTVALVLRRVAKLEGRVVFGDGDLPVGGARVTWEPDAGGIERARSRDDGTFVLPTAPAGEGTLSARLPFRGADLALHLPEDGLADVVLRLEPRDEP